MKIILDQCELRTWRESDARQCTRHANNPKIKRYLRDRFPHPFALKDAEEFIAKAIEDRDGIYLCITDNDRCIGSISARPMDDKSRYSAEIGYWLSEDYWGRGIATQAVAETTKLAMEAHGMHRVFGLVEEGNMASQRVLLKAGYILEARLRHNIYRNGHFVDQLVFACLPE